MCMSVLSMESPTKRAKLSSGGSSLHLRSMRGIYINALHHLIRELLYQHTTESLSEACKLLSLLLKCVTHKGTISSDLFDSMNEALKRCGPPFTTSSARLTFYLQAAKQSLPMRAEIYGELMNYYLQNGMLDHAYSEALNKRSEWKLASDPIVNGEMLMIKYLKFLLTHGEHEDTSSCLRDLKLDLDANLDHFANTMKMPSMQLLQVYVEINLAEIDKCISLTNRLCAIFTDRHAFWALKIKLLQHKFQLREKHFNEQGDSSTFSISELERKDLIMLCVIEDNAWGDELLQLTTCEEYLKKSCADTVAFQLIITNWSFFLLPERLSCIALFIEEQPQHYLGWKLLTEQLFAGDSFRRKGAMIASVNSVWDEERLFEWKRRFFLCETFSIGKLPALYQSLVFLCSFLFETNLENINDLSKFLYFCNFGNTGLPYIVSDKGMTLADFEVEDKKNAIWQMLCNISTIFDDKFSGKYYLNFPLIRSILLKIFTPESC